MAAARITGIVQMDIWALWKGKRITPIGKIKTPGKPGAELYAMKPLFKSDSLIAEGITVTAAL